MLCALPASAATLNYSLGTGNGIQHGSGPGNVYEFVDQALNLNVSAWANIGSDVLQVSTITQFVAGLGACNPAEGSRDSCLGSPGRYQADNVGVGEQDWLLLFLPESVNFDEVVLTSIGAQDRDVTYWIGDLSLPADLAGAELGDLFGLGMGTATTLFNSVGDGALSIDLGGQTGNALLIGARLGDNDDRFMLSSLAATIVPVPPAMWLFGSALGFLVTQRGRRRRQRQQ